MGGSNGILDMKEIWNYGTVELLMLPDVGRREKGAVIGKSVMARITRLWHVLGANQDFDYRK